MDEKTCHQPAVKVKMTAQESRYLCGGTNAPRNHETECQDWAVCPLPVGHGDSQTVQTVSTVFG